MCFSLETMLQVKRQQHVQFITFIMQRADNWGSLVIKTLLKNTTFPMITHILSMYLMTFLLWHLNEVERYRNGLVNSRLIWRGLLLTVRLQNMTVLGLTLKM